MIRVLIADDEPLARERIRSLLADHQDVSIAGEAADGREAGRLIREVVPDVVFLDVQMPEMDGIRLIERLQVARLPLIVFVTAYDRHAVKAFDVNAVDYLLKPYTRARFQQTMERVRGVLRHSGRTGTAATSVVMLDTVRDRSVYPVRLTVRQRGTVRFVTVDDIRWIESRANYVCLHTREGEFLQRGTMTALHRRLDPTRFHRIHRSVLVNIDDVKELRPWGAEEQVVILTDGTQLPVGRTYRRAMQAAIAAR